MGLKLKQRDVGAFGESALPGWGRLAEAAGLTTLRLTSGQRRNASVTLLAVFLILMQGLADAATSGTNTVNVAPGPIVIKTNYYVFGGTNAVEMRQAMTEARPWKRSMPYDAHTKWDVRADYRFWPTNGEYRIQSLKVSTKIDVTLPMWIPGKPVPRELVARWQQCIVGLTVHELGHVQLAQAAAVEVKRKLSELPSYSSAHELKAGADATVADTITVFQERERKYDQATGHGRTQGAIFPVDGRPRRRGGPGG